MNKKNITLALSVLVILGLWIAKKVLNKKNPHENVTIEKIENSSYWTCPMHPQIHLDHDGECPICHMKLVKMTQTTTEKNTQAQSGDKRSVVQVSTQQLELIGVQKTTVEKMNLTAKIPISGRVLSSSFVAFQVYEKEIKYVHSGLIFKGESSSSAEDEISGIISSVDTVVDPTSRTIRVLGLIKKGSQGLLAETSFSGEILIELKDRLAIPESSVLHTGTQDIVYIFNQENKLTPQSVKLGIKTEGFFEVLSGLSAGDVISSGPNFLIDSEAKIRGAND